jgi:hypothetical protein
MNRGRQHQQQQHVQIDDRHCKSTASYSCFVVSGTYRQHFVLL